MIKKVTVGVFIDLKKAFDTINHNLLLKKLAHYGVRGVANHWLASYLSNRKQYVSIDECNSDLLNVLCGVPQGSILGPKLFILYVNDICNINKILKFVHLPMTPIFSVRDMMLCSLAEILAMN